MVAAFRRRLATAAKLALVAVLATSAAAIGPTAASETTALPDCAEGSQQACTDLQAYCEPMASLCQTPAFSALMAANCRKTCALCEPEPDPGPGGCVDHAKSCPTWVANGFCSSSFFTTAQKKSYCAKSCGLCDS